MLRQASISPKMVFQEENQWDWKNSFEEKYSSLFFSQLSSDHKTYQVNSSSSEAI